MSASPPETITGLTSDELKFVCQAVRKSIINLITAAGAGHTGGSLSLVEILVALYFGIMRLRPKEPGWEERDRFVLSKGHATPCYYATLTQRGYFHEDLLKEFDAVDSMLQGHPCMLRTPGVDFSTGSLGQGLSAAIGMVLGRDRKGLAFDVYCVLGDGEIQEGQVWEGAMYAGKKRLRGLVTVVDYNKVQLAGDVGEQLDLEPLAAKWEAFGWQVLECDGHDVVEVLRRLVEAKKRSKEGPVVLIAHTVKGKGVSFMEGRYQWHAKAPSEEERVLALAEIDECNA